MKIFHLKPIGPRSLGLALVVLLVTGGIGVAAAQGHIGMAQPIQRDFSSWSYVAHQENNGPFSAEVHFDAYSVQGIQAFATANKVLANELALSREQIEVLLVFKTPIAPDTYRAWLPQAGITSVATTYVKALDGRAIPNFQQPLPPIQFTIPLQSGDPLPQQRLDDIIKTASRDIGGPVTIQGVDAFRGKIAAGSLKKLFADPQVLLADVTADAVHADLRTQGVQNPDQIDVYNPIPIFGVEDLMSKELSH